MLVATGDGGKIYRLKGDPMQPALVTRATAQHVTALLSEAGRVLFATSNPGKVFRLSSTRADCARAGVAASSSASTGASSVTQARAAVMARSACR